MRRELTGRSRVVVFVSVVTCLIVLNLVVFVSAYPETSRVDSGCCSDRQLAKDFSAFYTAAWRLVHDPGQVYTPGYVDDGEFHVLPQPETYKYLPSFLFFVLPLTVLPYHDALVAFDVFQILLLPLIALLVYELMKGRSLWLVVGVTVIALLLPLPATQWSFSAPYYFQWAEGQSKVLETFLLVLSFYLGASKRPLLSGLVMATAAYDPRFVLVSAPLFLYFNRGAMARSILSFVGVFIVANAALLTPALGSGFISALESGDLLTPFYFYSLIPLLTVLALTACHASYMVSSFRGKS